MFLTRASWYCKLHFCTYYYLKRNSDTFGINDAFIFWASCHTQLTQLAVVALDAIFVDNYRYAKNLRQ